MNLPTWNECSHAVVSNVALDPLQQFVYDNEPGSPHDQAWRDQMQAVIDFVLMPRGKAGGAAPRATKKSALAADPILADTVLPHIASAAAGKTWRGTGKYAMNEQGEKVEIGSWSNPLGDIEAARLTRETGIPHAVDPRTGDVIRAGGGSIEIAPPVLVDPGHAVHDPHAGPIQDIRPVLGASAMLPQPTHRIA